MARAATITVASALLAVLVACGGGETGPDRSAGPVKMDSRRAATREALTPELAQALLQGPGGSALDDEIDLDAEGPLPLRIVLEPPSR